MLCCSCEDWALQSFPRAQLEWQEASLWDLCSSDPSSRTRFNLFQAWGAVKKSFFEKQKPIPKRLSCTWMWLQSLNFKVEKAKLQCCLIRNKINNKWYICHLGPNFCFLIIYVLFFFFLFHSTHPLSYFTKVRNTRLMVQVGSWTKWHSTAQQQGVTNISMYLVSKRHGQWQTS